MHLTIQLTADSACHKVNGFARGHFTIEGATGYATSKDQHPDQSSMVFLAIVEFLDGMRRFASDSAFLEYHFVATDSSFGWTMVKVKDAPTIIRIEHDGERIDALPLLALAEAVWTGVQEFLLKDGSKLPSDDPAFGDLESAQTDFQAVFRISPGSQNR